MGWTARATIQDEAFSAVSMVVSVVWCLHEQGQNMRLQLCGNIDYGVSEQSTIVNASFTQEFNVEGLLVHIELPEISKF